MTILDWNVLAIVRSQDRNCVKIPKNCIRDTICHGMGGKLPHVVFRFRSMFQSMSIRQKRGAGCWSLYLTWMRQLVDSNRNWAGPARTLHFSAQSISLNMFRQRFCDQPRWQVSSSVLRDIPERKGFKKDPFLSVAEVEAGLFLEPREVSIVCEWRSLDVCL